jgi:hypothetical protein
MQPEEYLYIDYDRLKAYYQDIGPPVRYDKVPRWTVTGGTKGVEVTRDGEKQQREVTTNEMIKHLEQHLESQGQLGFGRITDRSVSPGEQHLIRLETCRATHVFIPPANPESFLPERLKNLKTGHPRPPFNHPTRLVSSLQNRQQKQRIARETRLRLAREKIGDFNGLNIWISTRILGAKKQNRDHQLFLLLDYRRDDEQHIGAGSAYSALVKLYGELQREFEVSVLHSALHQINNPESSFHKRFLVNPIEAFVSFGATLLTERTITSLYRVRIAVLYGESNAVSLFATIGYPVYIKASSSLDLRNMREANS